MDKIAGLLTLILPTLIIAGYYWLVFKDIKYARETRRARRANPVYVILFSFFAWLVLAILFGKLFGLME